MANETRGVFRLRTLRRENVQGDGVDNLDVWLPHEDVNLSNYGYYVSGTTDSGPTLRSTVDRTDMSTDSTNSLPSSPIPAQSHDGVGLGNLTHLYSSNGWAVGSSVFKMDYSTESWSTTTPSARTTRSMGDNGVGNKLHGYQIMGDDTGYPGPENSTIQKLTYASDTWANLPAFPYKATWSMGASNDTRAIIAGGATNNGGGETSQNYKLTFADDSYLTLPGGMIQNASGPGNGQRAEASASGNATHMYVASGRMPSGMSSNTIKYQYSVDTWDRMPGANGSRTRRWNQAYGNTTHGYSAGGNSPQPNYSTVDKINYTNDTAAYTPGANLTVARLKGVVGSPRQNGWGASTGPGFGPYRWLDDAQGPIGYGVEFDGSDDSLTIPNNARWGLGNTFTVEAWIKPTGSLKNYNTIVSRSLGGDNWYVSVLSNGKLQFYDFGGGENRESATGAVQLNVWTHVAFSCFSGTGQWYVNGVASGTAGSMSIGSGSSGLKIGMQHTHNYDWQGSISNLRITKDQSLYNANFTVPTESLTTTSQGAVDSNVILLCCNKSTVTGSSRTPDTISTEGTPTSINQDVVGTYAPTPTPTADFFNQFPPNISNNGYIMKGWDGQNPSVFNSWILKMDMTTDTRSIPGSMPSPGRFNSASSSQTAAYSAGGPYTPGTGQHGSKTEKLTYSTESAALLPGANAGNVSDAIGYGTAEKGYSAFGYKREGGDGWRSNSQVRKLTYSNETWATLPGNFGYSGIQRGAFNDKKNAYFLGLPGGRAWKMDLTTDSWSTPAQMPATATWSPTFQGSGGTTGNGDGDKAGYKSGQSGQTADKLTYSTESIAAVPSAAYPGPTGGNRTFGSRVAGYWNSPGQNPGTKLVYSTETFTEIPGYWDVSTPGNPSGTLRDGAGTSALGNSVGSTAVPNLFGPPF